MLIEHSLSDSLFASESHVFKVYLNREHLHIHSLLIICRFSNAASDPGSSSSVFSLKSEWRRMREDGAALTAFEKLFSAGWLFLGQAQHTAHTHEITPTLTHTRFLGHLHNSSLAHVRVREGSLERARNRCVRYLWEKAFPCIGVRERWGAMCVLSDTLTPSCLCWSVQLRLTQRSQLWTWITKPCFSSFSPDSIVSLSQLVLETCAVTSVCVWYPLCSIRTMCHILVCCLWTWCICMCIAVGLHCCLIDLLFSVTTGTHCITLCVCDNKCVLYFC